MNIILRCDKHGSQVLGVCQEILCCSSGYYCHYCLPEHQTHLQELMEINQFQSLINNINEQFLQQKNEILKYYNKIKEDLENISCNEMEGIFQILINKPKKESLFFIKELEYYVGKIQKLSIALHESLLLTGFVINKKWKEEEKENVQKKKAFDINQQVSFSYQGKEEAKKVKEFIEENRISDSEFQRQINEIIKQGNNSIQQSVIIKTNSELIENKNNELQSQVEIRKNAHKNLLLQSSLTLINFQLQFSSCLKGRSIIINKNETTAIGNQFALCKQTIPQNLSVQFAFAPIQGEYIFIGVCNKTQVEKHNFKRSFKKENINHGAYLISSSGYSFSSLEEKFNYEPMQFKFGLSDIIIVQVDNVINKITWSIFNKKDLENSQPLKNLVNAKHQIALKINSQQELTPCVYLKYDASVEIINDYTRYF